MLSIHFCHPSRVPSGIPALHIQARPPGWVLRAFPRSVPVLVPQGEEIRLMAACVAGRKEGRDVRQLAEEYRRLYVTRLAAAPDRFPGVLQDDQQSPITGEVACVCTCSVSEAAAGRCHRAWAAEVMAGVGGWRVLLDGVLIHSETRT